MPMGDKTGPTGKGPLTGRGMGPCGSGRNVPICDVNGIPRRGRGGGGRGRGYGAAGMHPIRSR